MGSLLTQGRVAVTVGAGLTVLGVVGLLAGLGLDLTLLHDGLHLAPGLGLLAAGLPAARGRPRRAALLGFGGLYVAVGLGSLLVPGLVESGLGISPWENGLHLLGGLVLLGAAKLPGPARID